MIDIRNDWYFKPRVIERNGILYKMLGVKYFKAFVLLIPKYIFRNTEPDWENNYLLWDKSVNGMLEFNKYLKVNEIIHVAVFLAGVVPSMINFEFPSVFISIVTVINFYCVILQRYNRERLYRVIKVKMRND